MWALKCDPAAESNDVWLALAVAVDLACLLLLALRSLAWLWCSCGRLRLLLVPALQVAGHLAGRVSPAAGHFPPEV